MNIVDIFSIQKHYAALHLLEDISFTVGEGEKVGLIGRNGCGKSTLLKIIAGIEESDAGYINYAKGAQVKYLAQEADFACNLTVHELLRQPLEEVYARQQRFAHIGAELEHADAARTEQLLLEQQELQGWFDLHGAWEVEHRIESLCHKLDIRQLDARAHDLSGGERKRVALAQVLLARPDLLLLDEPTNHLDAQTVQWLEEELLEYPGALILVTHDRYFLDRVVGRMFEVEDAQLYTYTGNYTQYLAQKQLQLEHKESQQSRILNVLRREEAWLKRGAKARSTKQKARKDRVMDLRERVDTSRQRDVTLEFSPAAETGGVILELKELTLKADTTILAENISFIMRTGQRVGILGPNGCGKSTLLKTIMGQRIPAAGEVVLGRRTRIGYIDQQRSGLDPELKVAEVLGPGQWVEVNGKKQHKSGYLEDFLFSSFEQRKLVSVLSGGERARLLLALLMLQGANLLILDEPTNDLDIPTLQVLEQALVDYSGCVLLVTHDRYLLDRVATSVLNFEDKTVVEYAGNFSDMLIQKQLGQASATPEDQGGVKHPHGRKNLEDAPKAKGERAQKKGLSYKEKHELEALEGKIDELEQEKERLTQLLSNSATAESGEIAQAGQEFNEIDVLLEHSYARWEELELKK
ncbi:MAG: ABC-F family ATP-binding cassette domain-containing protein [Desulfuromonadaceae bacterium]|nr:ABC-F family ATP-binding cassette domain-containing protein [Desulfuromonadaceae bacterium]